jgi:anti-sigma regulatory factor (Ser/Thr protein kinase)
VALGADARGAAPGRDGEVVDIAIRRPGDAMCCAVGAKEFAGRAGLGVRGQWQVSIAVAELATNVLRYADEGTLRLSRASGPPERVVVEIVDRVRSRDVPPVGPGLGVGLECVHRMMDHVAIESGPSGRRVVAWKVR